MQEYKNKEDLVNEIKKRYELFSKEFDNVSEEKKDVRIDEVDRTPQEMIAYQLGWLNLIMGWEKDELAGKEVITPAPGYKWNQMGELYQSYYEKYSGYSLAQMRIMFKESTDEFISWLELVDEDTLFTPGVRKWTVTSANWPMWKWVHINTVAPFKSFRSKIRKWKKIIDAK